MGFISQLFPTNYLEEKTTFFSVPNYNPQFRYSQPTNAILLSTWGKPNLDLEAPLRQLIIDHPYSTVTPSEPVTKEYINQKVTNFNRRVPPENQLQVVYTTQMLARSMIRGNDIFFRLPLTYPVTDFEALFLHEADSHYLRSVNHSHQTWKNHTFSEGEIRSTEEGLASLHTRFHTPTQCKPSIFINYLAVLLASKYAFTNVYSALRELGLTPEKAWTTTFRTKRGLLDTAQPGGLTKDLSYLRGIIEVWHALTQVHIPPQDFYLGRIPWQKLSEYHRQPLQTPLILPSMMDSIPTYLETIATIGVSHHLAELAPYVL